MTAGNMREPDVDVSPTLPFKIQSREKGKWYYFVDEELILFEWKNYVISSIENRELEDLIIPGGDVEPFDELKIFEFSFKNYIGKSKIILKFRDGRFEEYPVTVLSEKLTRVEGVEIKDGNVNIRKLLTDFKKFVKKLTEDLTRISSSLNFSIESPTGFTVEESDEPVNELFAYHYFRTNKERILNAFETLMSRMKKELTVEEELFEFHDVDEFVPDTLISVLQHPEYLVPAKESVLIAKKLKGYAPTKILSFRKYETLDTPENRFVKFFLNLLLEWTRRILNSSLLKEDNEQENGVKKSLESVKLLKEELEFMASNPIWDEVGEMSVFPYTSQTLLKGDGYRELLQLFREFTAYTPFFDNWQKAIDNKNIPQLYEYWAFFKLVEELGNRNILGKEELKIRIVFGKLQGNVYAIFGNGWKLYYNRRLMNQSYSVPLVPDYSLFSVNQENKEELIGVFDAKFRSEAVEREEFEKIESELERDPKYTTWVKLEDIYKMHTYRDALRCKFAVVLYLGERSMFWETSGEPERTSRGFSKKFTLHDLIDRSGAKMSGVGYLPFNPFQP